MKKLLSLALVLALMLTLGVSAFAEIFVDGYTYADKKEVTVDNAQFVSANASGDNLTVDGNVTGDQNTGHISVECINGATITVVGNVTQYPNQPYDVIYAEDSNVKVGGDALATSERDPVIKAQGTSKVVVEGTVTGAINIGNNAAVYIGQLAGSATPALVLNEVHYLIGTDATSEGKIGENINISGVTDVVKGASEKEYCGTVNGETVTLTSNVDGKQLEITGLPEGTTYDPATGVLTLGEGFKGGLQNLKLVLVDKPGPGPDPTPVPVYYVVPTGSVTVVDFTLPDGIEEGLIKALDSADHAGLTIDKSLLAEGYDHNVKVTKGNEELPEGAYRFVINWDGSLSVILSTTYLKTLGDGSYDFVATVDDLVIPFTVVVAE